jgi:hypothetical protein
MNKLTPEQRAFLRTASVATLPFYDMVSMFIATFDVSPSEAGVLLAQWITESC